MSRLRGRAPAWPLATAALPVGFAVAQATGVRPVGGLAMVALGALAVGVAAPPAPRVAAWAGVALAAFVGSHVVAGDLGAWGAVALAGAVTGAAGAALLDGGRRGVLAA